MKNKKLEIEVKFECNQYFIFSIKGYKINKVSIEESVKDVSLITNHLDRMIIPENWLREKSKYLLFLKDHIFNIFKIF